VGLGQETIPINVEAPLEQARRHWISILFIDLGRYREAEASTKARREATPIKARAGPH
jgi:hypothetical protein